MPGDRVGGDLTGGYYPPGKGSRPVGKEVWKSGRSLCVALLGGGAFGGGCRGLGQVDGHHVGLRVDRAVGRELPAEAAGGLEALAVVGAVADGAVAHLLAGRAVRGLDALVLGDEGHVLRVDLEDALLAGVQELVVLAGAADLLGAFALLCAGGELLGAGLNHGVELVDALGAAELDELGVVRGAALVEGGLGLLAEAFDLGVHFALGGFVHLAGEGGKTLGAGLFHFSEILSCY